MVSCAGRLAGRVLKKQLRHEIKQGVRRFGCTPYFIIYTENKYDAKSRQDNHSYGEEQ